MRGMRASSSERKPRALDLYCSADLEQLILDKAPALWVNGHIHKARDYQIGETRVICNPAGYDGRDHEPKLQLQFSPKGLDVLISRKQSKQ